MTANIEEQLKAAASSGDVTQLTQLIQNAETLNGEVVRTLTREAASKSQLSVAESLFAKYPTVPLEEDAIRAAIYTGSIPLFSAFINRDTSIVNMQFDRRGTPLTIASMSQQPVEYLRFLLEAGADPNQNPDAAAFPLALVAAFYTDTSAADLLLDHGAKLEGSGALSAAAQRGNEPMLRHLLQRGASPGTDVAEGQIATSPLHAAARKGHVGALRILLDHGADATVIDSHGMTARMVAEEMKRKGNDMSETLELLKTYDDTQHSFCSY